MHLCDKGENIPPLLHIGIEPLDEQFTVSWLTDQLQRTKRKIKAVLLDQTIVAGLGNIYVDEVLFRSSIHPERLAATLTAQEVEALHEAIVETIREAIEKGGKYGSNVRQYARENRNISDAIVRIWSRKQAVPSMWRAHCQNNGCESRYALL